MPWVLNWDNNIVWMPAAGEPDVPPPNQPWGVAGPVQADFHQLIVEQAQQHAAQVQAQQEALAQILAEDEKRRKQPDVPEEGNEVFVNKYLVGCDPEFVGLRADGVLYQVIAEFGQKDSIGYDHAGRVMEVRPEPAKGTYTLIRRIHSLLMDARLQKIDKLKAGAKAKHSKGTESLGGHVWLDIPVTDIQWQIDQVAALDHLTRRLEALDILPATESEWRRGQGLGYGKFGDVRNTQNHAGCRGDGRYEYRTMASWLYDPKIAFICLTAAKLAAFDPLLCKEALGRFHDFAPLKNWIMAFKAKDNNAARVYEKLLSKGLRFCQGDPEADVKKAWKGALEF